MHHTIILFLHIDQEKTDRLQSFVISDKPLMSTTDSRALKRSTPAMQPSPVTTDHSCTYNSYYVLFYDIFKIFVANCKNKCPTSTCGYMRERADTSLVACSGCDQLYHCKCVNLTRKAAELQGMQTMKTLLVLVSLTTV